MNTLYPLRQVAHKFGGSNAQRDVIDQTLAASAARAGQTEWCERSTRSGGCGEVMSRTEGGIRSP